MLLVSCLLFVWYVLEGMCRKRHWQGYFDHSKLSLPHHRAINFLHSGRTLSCMCMCLQSGGCWSSSKRTWLCFMSGCSWTYWPDFTQMTIHLESLSGIWTSSLVLRTIISTLEGKSWKLSTSVCPASRLSRLLQWCARIPHVNRKVCSTDHERQIEAVEGCCPDECFSW